MILIVIVAMVIGFIWLFGTAFKSWANNYFGNYLTCLLETGELPSTGVGGGGGASGGICNQYFEPFSLKNGRPIKGDGGKNNGQAQTKKNTGGINENTGSRRPIGGGGGGGGLGNDNWAQSGRVNANPKGGEDGGEGKSKGNNVGYSSGGGYNSNSNRNGMGNGGHQLDGRLIAGLKKEEDDKKGYPVSSPSKDDFGSGPKRNKLKPPRVPAAVVVEDSPMTFGNFLRILIIAAIIIALVVLVGGQLLQIGKEMD